MRINSYTLAEDGSNYYRTKLPAMTLKAQGLDIEYLRTGEETRDADVLFFNRPAFPDAVRTIAKLVSDGYAVVVDVDDLYSHIRVGHTMYGDRAQRADDCIRWACKLATVVTATTPALIDEYGYGHGVVVPNYVPEAYFCIKTDPERIRRIGWSGTIDSHPNDLQQTRGVIARICREYPVDFGLVGPREQQRAVARVLRLPSVAATGWLSLTDYPIAVARLHLGIVPLEDCLFNDAKSWLKGLEMAAVGVPFVASATREYRRLHDQGIGLLATHRNDWYRHLQDMLEDPGYRGEVVGRSRQAARGLTIEANADRWAEVFRMAYRRRPVTC